MPCHRKARSRSTAPQQRQDVLAAGRGYARFETAISDHALPLTGKARIRASGERQRMNSARNQYRQRSIDHLSGDLGSVMTNVGRPRRHVCFLLNSDIAMDVRKPLHPNPRKPTNSQSSPGNERLGIRCTP